MKILPEPRPALPPQQLLDFLPPVNEGVVYISLNLINIRMWLYHVKLIHLESGRQLGVTKLLTHSQLTFVLLPFLRLGDNNKE